MQPGGKGESNCQLTDCTGGCCIWRTKAQLAHCYAALPSYLREPLNCAARSSLPVESFRAKCLLRRAAKHTRSRCSPFFVCFYFLLRALPLYHIHLSSIIICIYILYICIYIIRAFVFVFASFVLSLALPRVCSSIPCRSIGNRLSVKLGDQLGDTRLCCVSNCLCLITSCLTRDTDTTT